MTTRLLGLSTAIAAVALTAGLTAAQLDRADSTPAAPDQQAVQAPAAPDAPQLGPRQGRGPRAGRPGFGAMQGRGRGFAFRQNVGPGQGRGPMGRGGVGAGLNLTDDQRAKVEALHKTSRDQSDAIADELEFTRQTLHRETFADARDDRKIADLVAKVTTLEKQLFDIRLQTQTAISDLLTAEQRATMRAREGRGGMARGPRGGGPGGMGPGPRRGPGR
jgi:Spy/CpxP family protein refolding chaperone